MKIARWIILPIAAVLLASVGWIYISFRRDIAAQQARIATGSRIIDTRCGPIELAEAGQGQPLLIVHGTGGGFDQAMLESGGYVERGFRVLAPSRFGYLRTPFPQDASAEAQADQFACLLDALGIERTAIMGVSAGANSTMQFAIRHPERTAAMVLLVPASYKPPEVAASAPTLSPLGEKLLMTVVGSDFPFWFTVRFAHDTAVRMVLATPPEKLARASADEKQQAERVLNAILPISARTQGLLNDARIAGNPPLCAGVDSRANARHQRARRSLRHLRLGAVHRAADCRRRFLGFERGGHVWVGHQAEVVEQSAAFMRNALAATRVVR